MTFKEAVDDMNTQRGPKYLGDEEITFVSSILEWCERDPAMVSGNPDITVREARLIAGMAGQILRLESALATSRDSLAERYGA